MDASTGDIVLLRSSGNFCFCLFAFVRLRSFKYAFQKRISHSSDFIVLVYYSVECCIFGAVFVDFHFFAFEFVQFVADLFLQFGRQFAYGDVCVGFAVVRRFGVDGHHLHSFRAELYSTTATPFQLGRWLLCGYCV